MPLKTSYFVFALRLAMIAWLAFIAFASLVPFNWSLDAVSFKAFWAFLDPNPFRPRSGRASLMFDASLNVLLFLPVGFAFWLHHHFAPWARIGLRHLLLIGLAFATALQALQLLLPRRVASLSDAVWNGAGLVVGAGLAWLAWKTWQEVSAARARRSVTQRQ